MWHIYYVKTRKRLEILQNKTNADNCIYYFSGSMTACVSFIAGYISGQNGYKIENKLSELG